MITVLVDRWRPHPLAWIHRTEARNIVAELRASGKAVCMSKFTGAPLTSSGPLLLRLSDPEMWRAAEVLGAAGVAYRGRALRRWHAATRRGSDSLGLRIVRGAVPHRLHTEDMLVQSQIIGPELTVGVIDGLAGTPLRLGLPEGTPHTFLRKYLQRPARKVLAEEGVRQAALRAASALGVDWAARVDLIRERASGRLMFLECDVAPLVGPESAFAASLAAAGMARAEQLARLLGERRPKWRAGMGS